MQLVLDTKDLKIDKVRNVFEISAPDGTVRRIGPSKVSSIAVTAACWISAGAIELATANQIPILFYNFIGKVTSRLTSPYFESIATLRRQQVFFSAHPYATDFIIGLYIAKTEGQVSNLRKLCPKTPHIALMEAQVAKLDALSGQHIADAGKTLLATEAVIAKYYWQALAQVMGDCDFEKRSKHPANDSYNAATNYLYGMLYTVVESGIFAAGLDPHLGIFHADEHNKPVLAFDLIEPFRPWVDWLLIEQHLAKKVKASFFYRKGDAVSLNKEGKAFFIPLFNNWLRSDRYWVHKTTSVKNHIYQFSGKLANRLRTFKHE